VISDVWDGIDSLFAPGREIILATTSDEVVDRLASQDDSNPMGESARARILSGHTAAHRAEELERAIAEAAATTTTDAPLLATAAE
jgi:spore maturation protein CgeB